VFHSSGVSRRIPELPFISNRFHIRFVDDFKITREGTLNSKKKVARSRTFKLVLATMRIIATDETFSNIDDLRPWTISLRGHYTKIKFPAQVVKEMFSLVQESGHLSSPPEHANHVIIHYRLGDLLTLKSKGPLAPERFASINLKGENVLICSDSPDEAISRLIPETQANFLSLATSNVWEVIASIVNCRKFIGTPSKLSFWGIAFRHIKHPEAVSFLTREHLTNLSSIMEDSKIKTINGY